MLLRGKIIISATIAWASFVLPLFCSVSELRAQSSIECTDKRLYIKDMLYTHTRLMNEYNQYYSRYMNAKRQNDLPNEYDFDRVFSTFRGNVQAIGSYLGEAVLYQCVAQSDAANVEASVSRDYERLYEKERARQRMPKPKLPIM